MGYSIAIRARNQTLRHAMIKFINANWRRWSDVLGKGESISSRPGLGKEGGLDYDKAKDAVGFDYASHCHGWESAYIYSLTKWMAVKIGKQKTKFQDEDGGKTKVFANPVPYMVYDGFEQWPIIVVKSLKEAMALPKDRRWCATDSLGVYIGPEANEILTTFAEELFFDNKRYKAFQRELAKFDQLRQTDFKAWREKHHMLKVKHMRPEIDRMLPKVRAEVKRLDTLWTKTQAPSPRRGRASSSHRRS